MVKNITESVEEKIPASQGPIPSAGETSFATDTKKRQDMLKHILILLTGFIVLILIFSAGFLVGGMKAKFSYRWAESYHKNFAGPRGGFFGNWRNPPPLPGDFIESHGIFGEIIKINNSDFVIKGRREMENMILVTENTVIKEGGKTIKKGEMKVGDSVVVIGSPNDQGQITAELIRVFSRPGNNATSTSF